MRRRTVLATSLFAAAFAWGCASNPRPAPQPSKLEPAPAAAVPEAGAATTIVVPIPEALALDDASREAVQTLANAPAFGGEAVGYSGEPVVQVKALRRLVDGPRAADALDLVIEHGTLAGQLLAVTGLYYAAPDRFRDRLDTYRDMRATVPVYRGGCAMGFDQVSVNELVHAPGAMQLTGPSDSLDAWANRHPGVTTLVLDIDGGGYPLVIAGRR